MCLECGCGHPGDVKINATPKGQIPSPLLKTTPSDNAPGHQPHHEHHSDHGHTHGSDHPDHKHNPLTLEVHQSVLAKNDRLAERNRGYFKAKGLLVVNMVSGPGAGKTTLIEMTARKLGDRLRTGVIVGDLATDNDASRLRNAGVPVVQITTGTVCHLEAEMVARALTQLDLGALRLLIIENVGNLVCPAVYDLGEDIRVVLLSTTEGEDKPLKYPPLFHSAHAAVVTKTDLAEAAGFQRDLALANLSRISHHARLFELSARTGAGIDLWCDYLISRAEGLRSLIQ